VTPLEQEMRQVLARLEVVSHGTIYSYAPVGTKGGFGDRDGGDGRPPGGELEAPHERWARAWNQAGDDQHKRARALQGARDELEALTRRSAPLPAKLETPAERDARIVAQRRGWSASDVAIAERCLPRDVRRARQQADRDPETGDPLPDRDGRRLQPTGEAAEARRRRLEDLVDRRGYSLTAAARVVGVSRSTAERALGRRPAT
jgi:hypothetical protein